MSERPGHPRWVYAQGSEPDPRFSFANERTFLAWIRTSLALLAAGVAINTVDLGWSDALESVLHIGVTGAGIACPPIAWWRWARSERALRRQEPLPAFNLAGAATVVMTCFAVLLIVAER